MKAFTTYIESHVSNFNETNNSLKFMLMKALTTYTLQWPLKSTMFQIIKIIRNTFNERTYKKHYKSP
jgi:hypothetical protein